MLKQIKQYFTHLAQYQAAESVSEIAKIITKSELNESLENILESEDPMNLVVQTLYEIVDCLQDLKSGYTEFTDLKIDDLIEKINKIRVISQ